MCGIAAILLYPQKRSCKDWQATKGVLTRNLISNQERGTAATGLAVVKQDGQVALLKMPRPATEFVNTPEYHALLSRIDAALGSHPVSHQGDAEGQFQ